MGGNLEVTGTSEFQSLVTAQAGATINGANLTLGTDVDLVGDGSTSEISGITTANLGAGVVATNFYGSAEFLTDVTSGDITLADESSSASDFYIPFAAMRLETKLY